MRRPAAHGARRSSGPRRATGRLTAVVLLVALVPIAVSVGDVEGESPTDELGTIPIPALDRSTGGEAPAPDHDDPARFDPRPFPLPVFDTGLSVNDVVRDPVRPVMYATTQSSDPTYPDSVVTIDPQTGAVLAAAPLAGRPDKIAIADDGSALYVGLRIPSSVQQILLPSLAPGWTTPELPAFGVLTPWIRDIEVAPGDPDLVLVAAYPHGVSAIRGGVHLPEVVDDRPYNRIVFGASANVAFAHDQFPNGHWFAELKIDASGVTAVHQANGPIGSSSDDIEFLDGKIYTGHGGVYDVASWPPAVLQGFPPERPAIIQRLFSIDRDAGIATFIESNDMVYVFDLATRGLVERWALPRDTRLGIGALVTVAPDVLALKKENSLESNLLLLYPGVLRGANGEYTALTPSRVLDTRSGHGAGGVAAPLGPGVAKAVQITGRGGVPSTGVKAVVMNVTAVAPTEITYLSVYPTGIPLPEISNLNTAPGRNRPNLVTVPVGPDGKVAVYNAFGSTHVLFDIAGYYANGDGPNGSRLRAIDPVRLADTRHGFGGIGLGALGPGEHRSIVTTGTPGGAPIGAAAVVLNVTVTDTTGHSFLTVSPSDVGRPTTSNLNFLPGDTVANQVIVRVPATGSIDIFNAVGQASVIVDLVGYYEFGGERQRGRFITTTPFRAVDTRSDPVFPPPGDLWDGDVMTWGHPDEWFSAFAANVTVTGTTGTGYVVTYPHPGTGIPPETSTVNYGPGETVANHAIIRTGPFLGFLNRVGRTQVILDVFGAFS